jgi:hypothetical protein
MCQSKRIHLLIGGFLLSILGGACGAVEDLHRQRSGRRERTRSALYRLGQRVRRSRPRARRGTRLFCRSPADRHRGCGPGTGGTGYTANANSTRPTISADGYTIAYQSDASNIVAGDSGGFTDIFVYDRKTGITTRASTTADSRTGGTDVSTNPFVTPEGRYVVFLSRANNLAGATDTLSWFDVFVTARSP